MNKTTLVWSIVMDVLVAIVVGVVLPRRKEG